MAGETTSTNMLLPIPGTGVTAGPLYANDVNSALNLIDAHNHSAGSGVKITPSGLNINADLPFGGFSATTLLKASFNSNALALTGTNFAYVVAGNLYFNDGSGNQVQITSAGGVAGSPGTIGGLVSPAAATYSAGSKTFTWTAASGKAAAMDNGAVTIRETNVSSAKGITLASPSSLAADYSLTLFTALPGSTQYVSCSAAGVLANVTADSIGSAMTATGANAIVNTVTRLTATPATAGNILITASSGSYTNTNTSYTNVTNMSGNLTTTGKPVKIYFVPSGSGASFLAISTSAAAGSLSVFGKIQILRAGVTVIGQIELGMTLLPTTGTMNTGTAIEYPPGAIFFIDDNAGAGLAAATYTYSAQSLASGSSATSIISIFNCRMVAEEMR